MLSVCGLHILRSIHTGMYEGMGRLCGWVSGLGWLWVDGGRPYYYYVTHSNFTGGVLRLRWRTSFCPILIVHTRYKIRTQRSRNTRLQPTRRVMASVFPGAPRLPADCFCRQRLGGYSSWGLLGGLAQPQSPTLEAVMGIQRSNF